MTQKHLYYKSNSLSEMIFRCNCYPWHKLFEFGLSLTVCSYHVTYTFQSESTLYSSLNVYELSGCGFESTCRHLNFGLSPSKILKICFICSIEIPLNTMKNPFDFILKALFVLKIFKFCLGFLVVVHINIILLRLYNFLSFSQSSFIVV